MCFFQLSSIFKGDTADTERIFMDCAIGVATHPADTSDSDLPTLGPRQASANNQQQSPQPGTFEAGSSDANAPLCGPATLAYGDAEDAVIVAAVVPHSGDAIAGVAVVASSGGLPTQVSDAISSGCLPLPYTPRSGTHFGLSTDGSGSIIGGIDAVSMYAHPSGGNANVSSLCNMPTVNSLSMNAAMGSIAPAPPSSGAPRPLTFPQASAPQPYDGEGDDAFTASGTSEASTTPRKRKPTRGVQHLSEEDAARLQQLTTALAVGGGGSVAVAAGATATAEDPLVAAQTSRLGGKSPLLFRTQQCNYFAKHKFCRYIQTCVFAHGPDQLRTREQNEAEGLTTKEALDAFVQHELLTNPQPIPSEPPLATSGESQPKRQRQQQQGLHLGQGPTLARRHAEAATKPSAAGKRGAKTRIAAPAAPMAPPPLVNQWGAPAVPLVPQGVGPLMAHGVPAAAHYAASMVFPAMHPPVYHNPYAVAHPPPHAPVTASFMTNYAQMPYAQFTTPPPMGAVSVPYPFVAYAQPPPMAIPPFGFTAGFSPPYCHSAPSSASYSAPTSQQSQQSHQ